MTQFVNMRRWSASKLAKEVAFARSFADPTETEWLAACEAEVTRRYGAGAMMASGTVAQGRRPMFQAHCKAEGNQ